MIMVRSPRLVAVAVISLKRCRSAPVEDNPQLADTTHTTERHPALVPSALRLGNPDSTVKPSHGVVRSKSQVERGTTPL